MNTSPKLMGPWSRPDRSTKKKLTVSLALTIPSIIVGILFIIRPSQMMIEILELVMAFSGLLAGILALVVLIELRSKLPLAIATTVICGIIEITAPQSAHAMPHYKMVTQQLEQKQKNDEYYDKYCVIYSVEIDKMLRAQKFVSKGGGFQLISKTAGADEYELASPLRCGWWMIPIIVLLGLIVYIIWWLCDNFIPSPPQINQDGSISNPRYSIQPMTIPSEQELMAMIGEPPAGLKPCFLFVDGSGYDYKQPFKCIVEASSSPEGSAWQPEVTIQGTNITGTLEIVGPNGQVWETVNGGITNAYGNTLLTNQPIRLEPVESKRFFRVKTLIVE